MNKALLLLLVTLVQNQIDGILLPSPADLDKSDDNFQLDDWDNSGSSYYYSSDWDKDYQTPSKRSTTDLLTRRSSLDKNFMRFGRGSGGVVRDKFAPPLETLIYHGTRPDFDRFGRGLKDNFIRFGRGSHDNFIRFGRGSKDNFIRFGRISPDFFRSGKSERVNFIRFGKADKNFMRFGRERTAGDDEKPENLDNQNYSNPIKEPANETGDETENFERIVKAFGHPDNFIRFGKSVNQKEGRSGTNFLRFGKSDPNTDGNDDSDADEPANQDSYPGVMRVKRKATDADNIAKPDKPTDSATTTVEPNPNEHATEKEVEKRSTGYFAEIPEGFPRNLSPVFAANSWRGYDNFGNARWAQPYFPTYPNRMNPYLPFANMESKRDQEGGGGGRSGSNFIRFG